MEVLIGLVTFAIALVVAYLIYLRQKKQGDEAKDSIAKRLVEEGHATSEGLRGQVFILDRFRPSVKNENLTPGLSLFIDVSGYHLPALHFHVGQENTTQI